MSDQKNRPRGRPANAGPFVKADWELLIQMWPLVTEKGLPIKTAADQVTAGMAATAEAKNAAVHRVRRRFPKEKHLIQADVERRRFEVKSTAQAHGEHSARAGSFTFIDDVLAAKKGVAGSIKADTQQALAWNRTVRAALNEEGNELEAQLIRQAIENARTIRARLPVTRSRPMKRGR
jgi:hypothetical protein